MGKASLTMDESCAMFLHVAERLVAARDELTQADKAIGDGDHGIGMARGFEAVQQQLQGRTFATVDELLKTVGTALLTNVGGASGAVFGTLFRGGSRNLAGRQVFDAEALALLLADGLQAVVDRGKAQPGDKTMVDALEPAARQASERKTLPLDQAMVKVAEAAQQGVEATRTMLARVGKAKTLGERSLGHPDPGAVSTSLILQAMAEFVNRTSG